MSQVDELERWREWASRHLLKGRARPKTDGGLREAMDHKIESLGADVDMLVDERDHWHRRS